MFRKIVFIVSVIFLISSYQAEAGWVSDWVQQKTSVSPNYFQGQKRGYFTAGSYSARWQPSGTISPFGISAPSIKVGCGGIDIFGGAFNFVNPQYLVQQLQTMMQAAPAVAFDIALKTLCEQCSQTIKSIEAMIQRLNSLQFNACKTTKAAVFTLMSAISPEVKAKNRAMADETHSTLTGISDMFNNIVESEQSITATSPHTSQPAGAQSSYSDMIKDCPSDIKDVFATPNTTILEQIAKKLNFSQDYTNLIRGLVGDIEIIAAPNVKGKAELKIVPIPPCKQNKTTGIQDFYNGDVYAEDNGGYCSNAHTLNLIDHIQQNMVDIVDKMKSGATLTSDEVSLIAVSPVSVYQAIKASVAAGTSSTVVALLSDMTAKAYAYGSMSDLYVQALQLLFKTREILAKKGNYGPNCQLSITGASVSAINDLIHTIYNKQQQIQENYMKSADEVNAIETMINNFKSAQEIVRRNTVHAVNSEAVGQ